MPNYDKNQRKIDSICHQHKQPTIFQLKGVIIIKDFEEASKIVLNPKSNNNQLIKALQIFDKKLPSREWLNNNKNITLKIGQISRDADHEKYSKSVHELANSIKISWKNHYKSLENYKQDYEKLRSKSKKLLAQKLPNFHKDKIDEIELYLHEIVTQNRSSRADTGSASCNSASGSKSPPKSPNFGTSVQLKYKSKVKNLLNKLIFNKEKRDKIESTGTRKELAKILKKLV